MQQIDQPLAEQMQISTLEVESRKVFIRFTEEDAQRPLRARTIIEDAVDNLVAG